MQEYHVKQLQPNHADHISYYREDFLKKMFDEEIVIAQPKYDGERMLVHIDGKRVYCTSRRFSKKTDRYMENQERLPYLQEDVQISTHRLAYTVLDCECYANNWSEAASVLHSLPERAKQLQDDGIRIRYAVFDCLFYNGRDIRDLPYLNRLQYMFAALEEIQCRNMSSAKFMSITNTPNSICSACSVKSLEQVNELMQSSIDNGYEGIVLKSLSRKYYEKAASLKVKKFETVDCVVIDYQQGNGKYANTIGALIVGYYDRDKNDFIQISRVNCSTDAERDWWRDNWEKARYSVIEVKCQEITDRSLRHPVYVRRRDDKDFTMCTRETIFKEV